MSLQTTPLYLFGGGGGANVGQQYWVGVHPAARQSLQCAHASRTQVRAPGAGAAQQSTPVCTTRGQRRAASPELSEGASFPLLPSPVLPSPELEAPELDAPELDAPELDAPELDAPELDVPELDAPELDAPELPPPSPLSAM